ATAIPTRLAVRGIHHAGLVCLAPTLRLLLRREPATSARLDAGPHANRRRVPAAGRDDRPERRHLIALARREMHCAKQSVGVVIMTADAVVDRVLAAARAPPLQQAQLAN